MLAMAIAAIENDGDRSLVESLYTKYYALMLRKAQSMVRVTTRRSGGGGGWGVMLRLIERIDLLRGCNRASLRSYLVACVRNEAIDRLRRTGRIQFLDDAESGTANSRRCARAEIRADSRAQIQARQGAGGRWMIASVWRCG